MRDNNTVSIIGRITADAQIKNFDNGFGIITFGICCNSTMKNKEGKYEDYPNFFNVKYSGKNLGNFLSYLKKGKQVSVEGALHQDRWEKDGKKNSAVLIDASNVQLCGGGKREDSESSSGGDFGVPNDFQEDIPY